MNHIYDINKINNINYINKDKLNKSNNLINLLKYSHVFRDIIISIQFTIKDGKPIKEHTLLKHLSFHSIPKHAMNRICSLFSKVAMTFYK